MTQKDEDIANFWKRLIDAQNSDKAKERDAENIPSEEIARLNEDITKAFNYQGDIDDKIKNIIAVTKYIFGALTRKLCLSPPLFNHFFLKYC